MDEFCIFGVTFLHVIVLFGLFNVIPKAEEKDYKKINIGRLTFRIRFGTYQKASLFYFPLLFLFTLAMNEGVTTSNVFYLNYASASDFILWILIDQLFFFAFTGIPLLLVLRTKKLVSYFDSRKIRIMMVTYTFVLLLVVIPFVYMSHLNKLRLYEYIENLESQGITVIHSTYYFGGKTTPTKFENYTEVLDLVKANDLTLHISNGAPNYHFLRVLGPIQMWFYPPEGRVSMIEMY